MWCRTRQNGAESRRTAVFLTAPAGLPHANSPWSPLKSAARGGCRSRKPRRVTCGGLFRLALRRSLFSRVTRFNRLSLRSNRLRVLGIACGLSLPLRGFQRAFTRSPLAACFPAFPACLAACGGPWIVSGLRSLRAFPRLRSLFAWLVRGPCPVPFSTCFPAFRLDNPRRAICTRFPWLSTRGKSAGINPLRSLTRFPWQYAAADFQSRPLTRGKPDLFPDRSLSRVQGIKHNH